jgi:hypothetical protein
MTITDFTQRLQSVKQNGTGYIARCPAHDDGTASLSIGAGQDGRILLNCFAGCDTSRILDALNLRAADLFPDKPQSNAKQIAAVYPYKDATGRVLYEKVRYEPKVFSIRIPDGRGGYSYSLKNAGIEPILYNLPAVLASPWIAVTKGERDVATLSRIKVIEGGLSFVATTSPFGAGASGAKWRDSYTETLRGKDVYIIGDNDDTGRDFAAYVYQQLQGVARNIWLADIAAVYPELPPKGDVADLWRLLNGDSDKVLEVLCDAFRCVYEGMTRG